MAKKSVPYSPEFRRPLDGPSGPQLIEPVGKI